VLIIWLILMGINNLLLYYDVSDLYRRVLEVILPLVYILISKNNRASLGVCIKKSRMHIFLLLPGIIFLAIWLFYLKNMNLEIILRALKIIIFTGFAQELFYRGFLQTRAEKTFGPWKGLVFSSLIFTIYHSISKLVLFPGDLWSWLKDYPFLFIFGMIMGFYFQKTRSVIPIAFYHGMWDVVLLIN
jgi:membrane protease YdiL (CAAX protease family)